MQLVHHGGHEGVTGSCHQLRSANGRSLLIDCGLFQGDDARRHPKLEIEGEGRRVVFSGDLGAPHAPLLHAPLSAELCELGVAVRESRG